MRFTVSTKIAIGLAAIALIGLAAMAIIFAGLNTLGRAMHEMADEDGPYNAAAYEMEVNVNGIGFAVLKYLATLSPEYRAWVIEDDIDFGNYHATYMRFARTGKEKKLGKQVGALYSQFKSMGDELMQERDQQQALFTTVSTNIEAIDEMIDQEIQPNLLRESARNANSFEKVFASANLEADIAELGFWVSNYQRIAKPESKTLIFQKLEEFRDGLARFNSLGLNNQETRLARALESRFEGTAAAVREVVSLEDSIVENRQRFIDLRVAMDRLLDNEIQPLALRALEIPRQRADRAAERVQQTMFYLIPGFLLSAGLVGVLFVRSIIRPLNKLRSGTEAISRGNLAYRISATRNDEFSDLTDRFNQMTEQLASTTVSKGLLLESEAKLQQSVIDLRHQIEERERAEDQRAMLEIELRRSETMSAMGVLTAGVAHEVRNPLFGISSTLDAMEARFSDRTEYQRYIEVLRSEVDRMTKLMGDLLEYGKPTVLELSPGSVGDLIAEAMVACTPIAKNSAVIIAYAKRSDLPMVLCDKRRLIQAFQNLLENAIHFSPPEGVVTITTDPVDAGKTWVECVVRDGGPGFKPEDLPKLFEPFFTRRRGGTGLGLPIVQRIVEAHGGTISAANHAEGGAMITVRLPAAPAAAETN